MNTAPAPPFTHNYINYKKLRPNSKIFVPLEAFAPHESPESEIGEYMGSLSAGVAHMGGMGGIATVLHLIEMMEPLNERQSAAPTRCQSQALQYMYNSQNLRNPMGPGSRPGVWIDVQTAIGLGLITIPRTQPDAPFADRVQAYRQKREERPSPLYKNTNDYPQQSKPTGSFHKQK